AVSGRETFPCEVNGAKFENMLLAGDREGSDKFLREFRQHAVEQPYSVEAVELALMQMITIVSQTAMTYRLDDLYQQAKKLHDELKTGSLDSVLAAIGRLNGQLADFVAESKRDDSHAEAINKLRTYIDGHLHEDISLDSLAAVAFVSSSYISKLFREMLHVSFSDYLTEARMSRAAALLAESAESVADIAAQTGYSNSQNFCNRFKKHFGITPSQYRLSRSRPEPAAAAGNQHA
ncbi:MAG: helix-turn-helix transcriptional regulator, partial [Paenibacillaceae bacterium]|nr:helix-turn-helix transcriptional regulator [Paenibacillaceae bacterium]